MVYLKLAKILGPLLIAAAIGAYILDLRSDVAKWRGRVHDIAGVVQEVGGFRGRTKGDLAGKLGYKDVAPGIRKIGAQRDQARAEAADNLRRLNDHKSALLRQTEKVLDLAAEARRLKALSAEQEALVRRLKAERAGWIEKAERAATRTERLSAEGEARQCEEAMDALYHAGF